MTFTHRSYKKELLDADNIPFDDIRQNMKELNFINSRLGGHKITLGGVKTLAGNKTHLSVCEIGCGGGDNLKAIYDWCFRNDIRPAFTGIDIKAECIEYAKEQNKELNAEWITNDYLKVVFSKKPDIIFSSLFCHHFANEQLIDQLKWMKENSKIGFFINDLHRHPAAYYSIKLLTQLFSSSCLVKNDAPLSVLRGFRKNELAQLCKAASVDTAIVEWKWAFRFLVLYKHEQQQAI